MATSVPVFPGYEILNELGQGGMGVVYRARQLNLKRLVALKVVRSGIHASALELARFRTEAEAVARLQHPNIVHIYEVGEHHGVPYLCLELIAGASLDRVANGQPLPVVQAAQTVQTLARAMHHAHQQGIVHRDLKPSNVLFDNSVEPPAPKIADFGLAKLADGGPGQTRTATVLGTPSYMAPEQARGNAVGPPADIYALGAVLYELLTGRPPFQGVNAATVLEQTRHAEPEPPRRLQPQVPRDLETICLKCLEKAPGRRYASAEELADDLGRFLAHQPIRARRAAVWDRLLKWARRRPAVAGVTAVLGLAMAVFAALDLRHQGDLEAADQSARRQEADHVHKARARYQDFLRQRDDALFQGMRGLLFPAADAPRTAQATRQTVRQALAVVKMEVDSGTELVLDPYWTDAEKAEVAAGCCRLLLVLADAVALDGRPQDALALVERAGKLVPPTRAYHLRRARLLLLAGDETAAARAAAQAAAVQPAAAIDFILLGEDCYQRGDAAQACQHFQRALLLDPGDFWSQYFVAVCQLKLGRPAEAEAGLHKCLAKRPAFPWTHVLCGLVHEQLNAFEAAEKDFQAALRLGPDAEAQYVIHVTRGLMRFRRQQWDQAAGDLRQAIALKPERFHAHVSLARVYQAQKRWDDSSAEFELTSRLAAPAEVVAECHAERSRILYCTRKYQDALEAAEAVLKVVPTFAEGHQRRAFALLALKHFADAVKSFDQYLALGGKADADFYRGRGQARMQLGDFLGAKDDYSRGLDLAVDAELLAHRGWAYFFADAWKPALRDFDEAIRIDAKSADAHVGRGLALVMLGRTAEAVAAADDALERGPAAPEMMHNVACIFALAAVQAEGEAAAGYRDRAVDAVRRTLALVPATAREAFWRQKILPDRALDAVRDRLDFETLVGQ
jgi:tetratricopeptide (TPR) repeat protein